jgi:hypothetical protein
VIVGVDGPGVGETLRRCGTWVSTSVYNTLVSSCTYGNELILRDRVSNCSIDLESRVNAFASNMQHIIINAFTYIYNKTNKQTPWPLVRERTIPTERPPLVNEIWCQLLWIVGCRVVSATDPLRSLISVF